MTSESLQPFFCYNHPQRETRLRCNRCERPICNECAVLTPTGYRCKECVRSQQKIFETAQALDYVVGVLIAGVLSVIGSMACSLLGLFNSWFGFIVIFIAPFVGAVIAEAVRRATQRRRGRLLFRLVTAAVLAGALPPLLFDLLPLLFSSGGGNPLAITFRFLPLVWKVVYISIVTSTVYTRLTGIQIRK
ncbi:MAG: hypothetical protein HPY59_00100 [Anaerolineae bacterium]|nr:hypothetical protein [Anaerolineae bacterium]